MAKSSIRSIRLAPFADFFKKETSGSFLILLASILGLLIANTFLSDLYFQILDIKINFIIFDLSFDIKHLINDALMTIFFLLVGLEIKRELTSGHLASVKKAIVPLMAAFGGMLIPALIYLIITDFKDLRGWAVPVATDIALALGVLAYFGAKNASFLRPFLLGIAVIDDIGAILIIAFLFTGGFNLNWLLFSFLIYCVVLALKKAEVNNTFIYVLVGILFWITIYKAGIHPTIAGVILGLTTPVKAIKDKKYIDIEEIKLKKKSTNSSKNTVSVVEWLEHKIHPWSAYFVVPVFAFANTGVVIDSEIFTQIFQSKMALGIILGLVLGKPIGILSLTLFSKYSQIGQLPKEIKWSQILAVGNAGGIGFTVAIFIATLAFENQSLQNLAILSILLASIISAVISALTLRINPKIG